MSTLHLIRHGQASFGAEDYDVLSPLGVEQSRALGRYLAGRSRIDAIYAGPRRRQLDTARHMAEAAAEHGCKLPEVAIVPEMDEFPAIELFRAWLPSLAAENPELARALSAMADGAGLQGAAIQTAFETITHRWATGALETGELETFLAFCERVGRGMNAVMGAEGRGRRVALVTSGGPISVAVRMCLGLGDERTIRLAWVVANASLTELRWRGDELTLFGFNAVHHLNDGMVTYR